MKVLHPPIQFSLCRFCHCYERIVIFLSTNSRFVATVRIDCRGAGKTAVAVAVNCRISWFNLLIVTDDLFSRDRLCWTIWSFFSWERPRVIFTEFISIPRHCITWHGWRTGYFIFIKNPKPCKRNIKVSLASVVSCIDEAMIKISSRNIRLTFSFCNR